MAEYGQKGRYAQERQVRKEGDQPQAGHRDRPVRSEARGRQGTCQEIGFAKDEQPKDGVSQDVALSASSRRRHPQR
jgi:hypothetical protein